MKRILIVTALAATMAVAAIASPAGAGGPLPGLTVNPNQGRPGDAFTVSGGGCNFAPAIEGQAVGRSTGGRFAARLGPTGGSVSVSVAFPTPTATNTTASTAGDWSVGFVVPPGTPPGVYEVAATCTFNSTTSSFGRSRMGVVPTPYISGTYTVIGDPAAPPAPAVAVLSAPRFTG